jgi:dihydroorotase
MTQTLTITRPDDWHLHVRDGAAMAAVVPHSAAQFGRALIMPNLRPPVTTAAQAAAYRERILAATPRGVDFEPLMTLYLTDNLPPEEIRRAKDAGVVALKLYPAGATTNSDAGVTDLRKTYRTLEAMQREGLLLLVHGEVTDPRHRPVRPRGGVHRAPADPAAQGLPGAEDRDGAHHHAEAAQYVRDADRFTGRHHHGAPPAVQPQRHLHWAASGRTTTACRCSSARRTAWRWSRRPPAAARSSSWAPTARRIRRT